MAKPQTIQSGYYVALSLVPGSAPCNCYIGLVQAVDELGLRMDLVHWDEKLDMVGGHTEGLFVPWESVTSMLVCAAGQPIGRFIRDKAPEWQSEIEAMWSGNPEPKETKGKKVKE